jgi:hypothetical protein
MYTDEDERDRRKIGVTFYHRYQSKDLFASGISFPPPIKLTAMI